MYISEYVILNHPLKLKVDCEMDRKYRQNVFAWLDVFLIIVLINLALACSRPENLDGQPTVILISLDGFRWDYQEKTDTPNFDFLTESGVRTKSLIPVFPTNTFPGHYSIVTGLYPENHGIIDNSMYDQKMDARFSLGDSAAIQDGRWWEGEPFWVTTEKQGQISATYFWPGSEAQINGMQPSHWFRYDGSVKEEERIEQVLKWLDLPKEKRPTFITCYFSNLDDVGHDAGPESKEIIAEIQKVDEALGLLLTGLRQRNILNKVNIIMVSDHGMTETSRERIIFLDDYVDPASVDVINWLPLELNPKDGKEDVVYNKLAQAHPNLKIYRKTEMPVRFHFRNHHRIPGIIGVVDEGWKITTHEHFDSRPDYGKGGTHGYDHQLKSMGAIFIARGPAFKSGFVVTPFQNIHIYNLLADILDLEPAPNDGNLDSVRVMLRK